VLTQRQTVLSSHKALHTLRMLNLPHIEYAESRPTAFNASGITPTEALISEACTQKLADEVIAYMATRNSCLTLFAAQPSCGPIDEEKPSKMLNGHQWPDYAYRRIQAVDSGGVERAYAEPVPYFKLQYQRPQHGRDCIEDHSTSAIGVRN